MGSSNRKKKLKQQDFAKKRLKVGKTQYQENLTRTEFKAKRITISGSTKNLVANGSVKAEYMKKFSILKNTTGNLTSRKEISTELNDKLDKNLDDVPLDELLKVIRLLFIDQSKKIRQDGYDMLSKLVKSSLNLVILNHDSIMLFLFSAMTHLKPTIRQDSARILILLLTSGDRLRDLTLNNYWVRIWKNLMILMNWKKENKSYVDQNEFKDFNGLRLEQLNMILKVLQSGCLRREITDEDAESKGIQIHELTNTYMLKSNMGMIYRNLKLFGNMAMVADGDVNKDKEFDDAMICEDLADRVRVFVNGFIELVESGLKDYLKTEDSQLIGTSRNLLTVIDQIKQLHSEICVD